MPAIVLDCKGLACPKPVLQCKDRIEKDGPEEFEVIVDNEAAKENVYRFLGSKGYEAETRYEDGLWRLTALKKDQASPSEQACEVYPAPQGEQKVCVFITSSIIGRGDDELGGKLMLNFLDTLPELGDELWRIVLLNSGVKLAVKDGAAMEKLKAVEDAGATILVCGTCLDHFGLLDEKAVGQTTNMMDVVTSLQLAGKVIHV
jgi:selenium metabolism protein YedF